MKKLIIGLAIASVAVSCKKVADGGNKNVLKLEEGVERYSDVPQGGGHGHGVSGEHGANHTEKKEKVSIDLNGVSLKGYSNGLEQSIVAYLKSGKYSSDTEEALKNTWYNFDNVNFKMGSANQLEAGSQEQLSNLAKILKAFPESKIKIGGYTDKTGNEAANLKLSKERAEFIKNQLTQLGAGSQVIAADGYGSQYATVAKEASDEERAMDRKMAVRFTK